VAQNKAILLIPVKKACMKPEKKQRSTYASNNIDVVVVHKNMVQEQPQLFFLHHEGVSHAARLANALQTILAYTGKKKGTPQTKSSMH
jgi:hypothetical protein